MVVAVAVLTTACADAGSGRDASPAGRVARYCETLRGFAELDLLFDETPERVRSDLDELLALTKRAARLAPQAIRADAEAAVAAQERFNALYAANGWDPEATNRDREFIAHANDPELGALYVRLQDYQTRVCGPDPRTTDPSLA